MNYEFGMDLKGSDRDLFATCLVFLVQGLKEIKESLDECNDVSAEVRTKLLLSTKVERYSFTNILGI
jgi:hypothetical protein